MNNTDVINKIQEEAGKDFAVCEKTVKAYEEYCCEVIKRPFKKEIDDEMVQWINEKTQVTKEDVSLILTSLVKTVRAETKHRIPFIK